VGIEALWTRLEELAKALLPPPDQIALNRRQRALATAAAMALERAATQDDLLLLAEELRSGLRAFDAVTGRAGVEAMLDALFARFCIGK
jgi:tRNA modification GTPase